MSLKAEIRCIRPLLGTFVEIGARGNGAERAVEAAFAEIAVIHRLMSFHEEGSDVSRINSAPLSEAVSIDTRTYEVLHFAREIAETSAGAFDITAAGRLVEAGFLPRPNAAAIPLSASFRDIVLLNNTRAMRKNSAWIDLGGIAKGYAVDRAVMVLQEAGIRDGIVNAGGDMKIFGEPQPVHLRHPSDPEKLYSIGLIKDSAVASSSGCYGNSDKSTSPLVDPAGKTCVSWEKGITVIAPGCMAADALTKVVRLADSKNTLAILALYSAKALLVDANGVHMLAEKPQSKGKVM